VRITAPTKCASVVALACDFAYKRPVFDIIIRCSTAANCSRKGNTGVSAVFDTLEVRKIAEEDYGNGR
jgi:hypothetical protein